MGLTPALDADLTADRLLPVDEPHLVGRYNKALQAFGLPPTKLGHFTIDRSGFSPEVAAELGDPQYLDPNAVNRRFIILTPAQGELPVVHTAFSNTSQLLREFFTSNARAIDALTIKDVIYGEIEDSVAEVASIEDLLSISQVDFRVLSAEDVLGKAAELGRLVDRLRQEPDAWRDDAMLARMVELAAVTGDIRENALVPDQVIFRHNAFWTSHFGGVYVFIDTGKTTVVCDPAAPGFRRSRPWAVSYLSVRDPAAVWDFLAATGRVELPRASWLEASGYLEHRAEMVIRALVGESQPGREIGAADRIWLQTWIASHADAITAEGSFPFLNTVKRSVAQEGRLRVEDVEPAKRFLVARGRPDHADAWLVNALIVEFVPSDFVSAYVFNKTLFARQYEAWPAARRADVVGFLKSSYLRNKDAFRAKLYGLKSSEA